MLWFPLLLVLSAFLPASLSPPSSFILILFPTSSSFTLLASVLQLPSVYCLIDDSLNDQEGAVSIAEPSAPRTLEGLRVGRISVWETGPTGDKACQRGGEGGDKKNM